ncbi:MAG: hypothetical protein ACLVJK_02400 [Alistipes putredinis]
MSRLPSLNILAVAEAAKGACCIDDPARKTNVKRRTSKSSDGMA